MGAFSALVSGGVGRPLATLLPQCRTLAPKLQHTPIGLRKVLLHETTGPARQAIDLRICSSSSAEASLRLDDSVLALAEPDAVEDAKLDAWYMDSSQQDQRLPHRLEPNEPVSLEELRKLGVVYWKLDADNAANDPKLQAIRAARGYTYEDVISVSPDKLPGYEEKIKSFFEEHIHSDEEIRFVLDGSGYFDVRDRQDRWIRIDCRKGDMIVLPEGIYHRFTLDEKNYIKAMRLFVGDPVWTPLNRPQDNHASRQKYVDGYEALRLASAS